MERLQELRTHWFNMHSSIKAVKNFRPTFSWLKLLIGAVVVFVLGFSAGLLKGIDEGTHSKNISGALSSMFAARSEAENDFTLTDRQRRRDVDIIVLNYAQELEQPDWQRRVFRVVYGPLLRHSLDRRQELGVLKRIAGDRLTFMPKPQFATLNELNQKLYVDILKTLETQYEKTAAAYSAVLEREVKPIELVTSWELKDEMKSRDMARKIAMGR